MQTAQENYLARSPRRHLLSVTPSHLKNYQNPHLSSVWYRAERLLRTAYRAVFVGYSLPDADVEVIYLLKRGLAHLHPGDITVVAFDKDNPNISMNDHPAGRRCRSLFGDLEYARIAVRGLAVRLTR